MRSLEPDAVYYWHPLEAWLLTAIVETTARGNTHARWLGGWHGICSLSMRGKNETTVHCQQDQYNTSGGRGICVNRL